MTDQNQLLREALKNLLTAIQETPATDEAQAEQQNARISLAVLRAESLVSSWDAQQPDDPLLQTEIKPRPLSYSLDDYHRAPGKDGPLGFTWEDKPHRIVYDLIAAVKYYAQQPKPQPMTDEVFDLICKAIDKADTITMEGDYMLDSADCIAVVRVMQVLLSIRHGITSDKETT